MSTRTEALKTKLASLVAAAPILTEDEAADAAMLAQIAEQEAAAASILATKRGLLLADRLERARATAGDRYPVAGVDLVLLFPLGSAPPVDSLPGGGVIIIRSPLPEAEAAAEREAEHRTGPAVKSGGAILCDLVCASTVDPLPEDLAAGALLRGFFEAFPAAAKVVGGQVRDLGGAKAKADKRGR